jgi:Bax protein
MKFKIGLLLLVVINTTLLSANSTNSTAKYSIGVIPTHMSVQEKKKRFFALFVPAIQKVYAELEKSYVDTQKLVEKDPTNAKLKTLMKSYSAKNLQDLLERMKPHPKSIALAQSAMESAWGTSRFLSIANNVFGVWSINANEPRVAAGKKRGDRTIYVKKYKDIEASIYDYYKLLATGKVFQKFRDEKMKTNDPLTLVKYLDKYSERGAEYGKELASMIRYNKLTKYDK